MFQTDNSKKKKSVGSLRLHIFYNFLIKFKPIIDIENRFSHKTSFLAHGIIKVHGLSLKESERPRINQTHLSQTLCQRSDAQ